MGVLSNDLFHKLGGVKKTTAMSHNKDIETNYSGEENPSKNEDSDLFLYEQNDEGSLFLSSLIKILQEEEETSSEKKEDEDEGESSTTASEMHGVQANSNFAKSSTERGNYNLLEKIPMGNTLLHLAALCGNEYELVEKLVKKGPQRLAEKNDYGDTALNVAAKFGHVHILKIMLDSLLHNLLHPYSEKPKEALDEILVKNKQGNTFFHEALLNGHKDVMEILRSQGLQIEAGFKELVERVAMFWTNNDKKSVFHMAIEKGYEDIVDHALTKLSDQHHPQLDMLIEKHHELDKMMHHPIQAQKPPHPLHYQDQGMENWLQQIFCKETLRNPLIGSPIGLVDFKISKMPSRKGKPQELINDSKIEELIPYGPDYVPPGEPPLIVAVLKHNPGVVNKILEKKKDWIKTRDGKGRIALHYAASRGYIDIVEGLLKKGDDCEFNCNMISDWDGLFPLHLASAAGHVEVVKILLRNSQDPRKILDNYGRNILHIAALLGNIDVVRYILQQDTNDKLVKMINAKDAKGNTPLHLATLHCHPKIVHVLTWEKKKVQLDLVNTHNQTALDVCMQFQQENPPLRQRLIRIALESAGVKYAERGSDSIKVPPHPRNAKNVRKRDASSVDIYKDRINTLMLVSTLITTVSFAAGFTLPGGTNNSDPGQGFTFPGGTKSNSSDAEKGMALMLHQLWFKPFIFAITISMYGATSATNLLIWAQLGDITLTRFALKVAIPLLGIALLTLSVAFLAGVHLVISDLSWLATTVLVLCVISILLISLLYILLWFFSSSSHTVFRYIFYYPFKFLIWLDEQGQTPDKKN